MSVSDRLHRAIQRQRVLNAFHRVLLEMKKLDGENIVTMKALHACAFTMICELEDTLDVDIRHLPADQTDEDQDDCMPVQTERAKALVRHQDMQLAKDKLRDALIRQNGRKEDMERADQQTALMKARMSKDDAQSLRQAEAHSAWLKAETSVPADES